MCFDIFGFYVLFFFPLVFERSCRSFFFVSFFSLGARREDAEDCIAHVRPSIVPSDLYPIVSTRNALHSRVHSAHLTRNIPPPNSLSSCCRRCRCRVLLLVLHSLPSPLISWTMLHRKTKQDGTYALQVGEISGPVDSDSGLHIILRTA